MTVSPPPRKVAYKLPRGGAVFEVDARYTISGKRLGEGSFGSIADATDTQTGERVAIKRVKHALADSPSCKTMLREIRLMRHFQHENILSLRDIMTPPSDGAWENVYLVLDKMDTDLHYVLHSGQTLTAQHTQWILYQLLRGLKSIHSAKVLHRDLKPSNLLLNKNVDLKICDFGLARGVDATRSPQRRGKDGEPTAEAGYHTPLTEYVVTRWYRAPELLVMNREYDEGVDLWSVGCILAECVSRQVLFQGKDYLQQTKMIIDGIGAPSPAVLARTVENPAAREYILALDAKAGGSPRHPVRSRMPKDAEPRALELMAKLLAFDSAERPSADEALAYAYFDELKGLNDEPDAPALDFDFEEEGVSEAELRAMVWDEMRRFHPAVPALALAPPVTRNESGDDGMRD